MPKTLTVIDTFGFFFRSYYALPPLKSRSGFPTGLLTGFANLVMQFGKEYETDFLVFALDSKEGSFRKQIDPDYKANRPEPPKDLKKQLPVAIEWIEKMGFHNLSESGFEADDIIASLVRCAKERNFTVRIVSHDKDLYQLIEDGRVSLFDPVKKSVVDRAACLKKFGVGPEVFMQYQSLLGDSSDNVPGVKGIGAKSAEKLITEYGTLENIYENLESVQPARVQNLLREGRESAFLSRELVTLRADVFESCELESFVIPRKSPLLAITSELLDLDMRSIVDRIKKEETFQTKAEPKLTITDSEMSFEPILLDTVEQLEKTLALIPEQAIVAFDTETDSLDTRCANLIGFSFAWNTQKGYYVPIGHSYLGVGKQVSLEEAETAIQKLLTYNIVGHNLKFDLGLIYNRFRLDEILPHADTMIMAWLANPEQSVGLDSLMKRFFNHEMISFKDTVAKGMDFSSVSIESACRYAAEDAVATYMLYEKLSEMIALQNPHLTEVLNETEIPFINILIRMEHTGITVDTAFFEQLGKRLEHKLTSLIDDIYARSQSGFNINSTQQLGKVLFEGMGFKATKKTKTGYSTNEKVLHDLFDKEEDESRKEFLSSLLEYRELHKLKSTYVDPLLRYAAEDPNRRVYTSFLHTGTATGRLSSKDPNLQNIPVKTELGREIRKGFIAKEGHRLISIDYSQIELRLLAHFCEDLALVQAFREDKDIHTETAIRIFGEKEAKEKRNVAKSINFGLIYGMGARRLGETLKIPQKEAKYYIDSYFASFPTVKRYLGDLESRIKEQGFTETLLGRRRYFDFANAASYQQGQYLREGVNAVFQGSAADLIKLSMIKIHACLKNQPASMLLQVHDELIFEAEETNAESLAGELAQIMETIRTLNVPLKCGVSIGQNWGELK